MRGFFEVTPLLPRVVSNLFSKIYYERRKTETHIEHMNHEMRSRLGG